MIKTKMCSPDLSVWEKQRAPLLIVVWTWEMVNCGNVGQIGEHSATCCMYVDFITATRNHQLINPHVLSQNLLIAIFLHMNIP